MQAGGGCRLGARPSHLPGDPSPPRPQLPLEEGLTPEEKGEEEETEEEDSSFKFCVPGTVTLQSPLHKTFRSTDTVGKRGAPTSPPASPGAPLWLAAHGCDISSHQQVEPEDLR